MKKKKITYGVSGMMEYQAVIKVGKKNVSINFSDGSMSAMGTNPATFTTDNIIIQNAIEASNDYKRGRIAIVNEIVLDEELPILRTAPKPIQSPTPVAPTPAVPTPAVPTLSENEASPEPPNATQVVENTPQESNGNTDSSEKAEEPALHTQVEFSCNDDAKDYLEQNFGYVRSKLRNREDMINAGKAHGVEIIFV